MRARNWRWMFLCTARGIGLARIFLQLNGADALVFTAGIGENRPALREAICANLDQLGIVLDPNMNEQSATRRKRSSARRIRA